MCKTYVQKLCDERGLQLTNAARPLVIGVAVDDILKSRTKNSKCCAFARACKREPGVRAAYFFRTTAFLEFADRMVRYSLPSRVQKEIVSFDRAGIMAPGTYELIAPSASRIRASGRPAKAARSLARVTAIPLVVAGRAGRAAPAARGSRPLTPYIRSTIEPR